MASASAICRRSRVLDETKDVTGNVMEGVAEKKAKLDRYNELAMNYSDETADEMAQLQDEIDAPRPVGPGRAGRAGDGCAPLPAGRCQVEVAVRRREAARRALQAAARQARYPAARRADQPSRRRERRLARASFARLSRHRDDGHPRPLLPRGHHRMDARARSRAGHSLQGQLFVLARAEAEAGAGRGQAGRGARADPCARARLDQGEPQGATGKVQGAHPRL